jgi:hypothetical protein
MKTFTLQQLAEIDTRGFSIADYKSLSESSGSFEAFHAHLLIDEQLAGMVQASAPQQYKYFWIQTSAESLIETAAAICFPGVSAPLNTFIRLLTDLDELRRYYELNQPRSRFQCAAKFIFHEGRADAGARMLFLENKNRLTASAAASEPDEMLFFDGRKFFRYSR